jgi:[protein-PII] uridylyltransferase
MSSIPYPSLSEVYALQSAKIRSEFESTGDGLRAIGERSHLVDRILIQLYREFLSEKAEAAQDFCLVAVGGYGRQELFPYSDIDLLFLCGTALPEHQGAGLREPIASFVRTLWDLRLRVGHSTRTVAECGRLQQENLEFSISLLDSRYLTGDPRLFARLHDEAVPHLMARDRKELVGDLAEMTRQRHQKHGGTIFHLEPNLKEAPGGLRDYHVCRWLAQISELDRTGRWVNPEEQWPLAFRSGTVQAFKFLAAARTLLHYARGRDDNALTYELQDQVASMRVGVPSPAGSETTASRSENDPPVSTADWMRIYFRRARSVYRLTTQLLDSVTPARSSLYEAFQDWRSRLSNADFSVLRGRIFPRQPASASDLAALPALFEMIARHGLELSLEAENWTSEILKTAGLAEDDGSSRAGAERTAATCTDSIPLHETSTIPGPALWTSLRSILLLPDAPQALRAMHRLGVLVALFPEFRAVDALVIRDFYHRYTVDEHSFMTIQNVHELRALTGLPGALGRRSPAKRRSLKAGSDAAGTSAEGVETWTFKFSEILDELEQPELLLLSLLFHDVGKGMPGDNHIVTGLQAIEGIMARLDLDADSRDSVRFLIGNHLEMSRTMQRRDIFDIDTIRAFAEKVGTPERLKMLCLFTYADIKAVNPDALTPWKTEMLWRLYVSTANYLTRSLDEERVRAAPASAASVAAGRRSEDGLVPPLEATGTAITAAPSPATGAYVSVPAWSAKMERITALLASAHGTESNETPDRLGRFLEGFPKRYLETHSPEEIAQHFRMSQHLAERPVQLFLRGRTNFLDLTVLTLDRPFLFASLTGTLSAWGMNILKADAFSNASRLVLDTFRFVDLYKTLELNPSESGRLEQSVVEVLGGGLSLATLMGRRARPQQTARPKVEIPTQIGFDNTSSSHSTLLELITQDRPGLLHRLSSVIAERGCNIEVALIDTEGKKVIDVFYLTSDGLKLDLWEQESLQESLLAGIANIE